MTSRDLFQALLRFMGVWLLYYGISGLFGGLYFCFQVGLSAEIVGEYLARVTPQILIGLYLFSGAGWVVRHCYGTPEAAAD